LKSLTVFAPIRHWRLVPFRLVPFMKGCVLLSLKVPGFMQLSKSEYNLVGSELPSLTPT